MAGNPHERLNFNLLLGLGVGATIVRLIASPSLVLPYIYISLGAPVLFAGMLIPIVNVARLVARLAAAPLISSARVRKWYMVLGIMTVAASLSILGVAAGRASTEILAAVFLLAAFIIGIGRGLSRLTFQDMLGYLFPRERRNALMFTIASLSGLLAIAVALATHYALIGARPLDSHLALLWLGVGISVLSGLLGVAVVEAPATSRRATQSGEPSQPREFLAEIRRGLDTLGTHLWFRRFTAARCLFLSVELATPFYAIHAASLHKDKAGTLSVFVISACFGLAVGGLVWRRIALASLRKAMIAASATAALAGVLAVAIALMPQLQHPLVYAGVFFLIIMAVQGLVSAHKLYLVAQTNDTERPYFIAVADTVTGSLGILLAFALGYLAHLQHVIWPIFVLIVLNLTAALYATRLPPTIGRAAVSGDAGYHEG